MNVFGGRALRFQAWAGQGDMEAQDERYKEEKGGVLGLRPGCFQKQFFYPPGGGLLLGLRPGCFLKQFFYPPGGFLLLGLRPGCFLKRFFCPPGRGFIAGPAARAVSAARRQ